MVVAVGDVARGQSAQPALDSAADHLLPGDVVRVRAIGDPEIVGEFTIDETGIVTLPKLGPINATSSPAATLKRNLLGRYAEFLRYAPEVVFLRRIMVWGAVNKPGLYPVDPTMSLANVLVLAGGASSDGKPDKIRLIRGNTVITGALGPQTLVAQTSLRSGDQLYVPEKPWLARNTGIAFGLVSIALTVVSLATR